MSPVRRDAGIYRSFCGYKLFLDSRFDPSRRRESNSTERRTHCSGENRRSGKDSNHGGSALGSSATSCGEGGQRGKRNHRTSGVPALEPFGVWLGDGRLYCQCRGYVCQRRHECQLRVVCRYGACVFYPFYIIICAPDTDGKNSRDQ